MKILLSPAKKMLVNDDDLAAEGLPALLDRTEVLLEELRSLSEKQLKDVWKCSDKLVRENAERLERTDLRGRRTPALFAYSGLAYRYLNASGMNDAELAYLQEHLRILSGFYGILKPFDGVVPYRLEMQAQLPGIPDLYAFWGEDLYRLLDDPVIVDLASKEYSRSIVPYLKDSDRYTEIVFAEEKNGKLAVKGTMAKMARGEMVSWMAENGIEDPVQLRAFDRGYAYREDLSGERQYVFVRKEGPVCGK